MDPFTYVMIASLLLASARGSFYILEFRLSHLAARLMNAKGFGVIGGVWFAIVGAPLAAWFLVTFFIMPLLGLSYNLNIQTILNFGNPMVVLIFLFLWLGIAFGFFGGSVMYEHRKAGRKR